MHHRAAIHVHLRRHGFCWLAAVALAALTAVLVGLSAAADGLMATPTPGPTAQRTGDLGVVAVLRIGRTGAAAVAAAAGGNTATRSRPPLPWPTMVSS